MKENKIEETGEICMYYDSKDSLDKIPYNNTNYFNDKDFAEQVKLHQLLYRKLLKFAYDNGFEDKAEWDGCKKHWHIFKNYLDNNYDVFDFTVVKFDGVCFSSKEGAVRAIKEVVKPFMKEHPDFVW